MQFSRKQDPAANPTAPSRRQAAEVLSQDSLTSSQRHGEASKTPQHTSFDEALQATGILAGKGPVPAGESGSTEQYTQPFQVLSWYPRYVQYMRVLLLRTAQSLNSQVKLDHASMSATPCSGRFSLALNHQE